MTQQPAASVPVGTDGDGLPVGLQIVAARHRDDLVLRAAHALYETEAAGIRPPDPARARSVTPG
jgi:aspartyl-tRNA(Asn)/glutamyl-tRNA(Gln) amidotransferase subunit A